MNAPETPASIRRGTCPLCGAHGARPAIVTTLAGGPAFVLVCDRCGRSRGYNG